jgi:hypothetical protein
MFINIISNVITVALFALISWGYLYLSHHKRLLQFFGIDKSHRIVIYPSNLRVKQFGAIGVDGKERSYVGSAGAYKEILVANSFRELFNHIIPSLSENPGILSKLLISDVQVQITLSPLKEEDIEKSTSIITLGTPAYNLVSGYVESKLHPKVHFLLGFIDKDKHPVVEFQDIDSSKFPPSGIGTGSAGTADSYKVDTISDTAASTTVIFPAPNKEINKPKENKQPEVNKQREEKKSEIVINGIPPIDDPNAGFVGRIFDKENDRQVFYVAGLSEDSTANAAYYLIDKWLSLNKKKEDFVVMLHFEQPVDRHPTIIFEC